MEPGKGYWVKLNRPKILIYPDSSVASSSSIKNRVQLSPASPSTNEWINVYSTDSSWNGQPVPIGTTITAIGDDGRILAQSTVEQEGFYGLLPIYRDDSYTEEIDGARANESIRFLINGQPATITNQSDPKWTQNGDLIEVDLAAVEEGFSTPNTSIYLPFIQH